MNESTLCLNDEESAQLLSGEMESDRKSGLEQHLAVCIECRNRLEHQVGDEGWWSDTQSLLKKGLFRGICG